MNYKEIFLVRLQDLINESQLTLKSFCGAVGLNVRTVRRWFKERSPKVESLIKIANFCKCSIDYLVGLDNVISDFTPNSNNIIFYERYLILKKENELNDSKIAAFCKFSAPTIVRWNKGAIPDVDIIIKLCNLFDCSFEYLIGRID